MRNRNPFKKIYEFGKMIIIHPSGVTITTTVEQMEFRLKIAKQQIKDLIKEKTTIENDLAKIASKSRIKRVLIKRKIKNGKKKIQKENIST